jgi:hypothetical protein
MYCKECGQEIKKKEAPEPKAEPAEPSVRHPIVTFFLILVLLAGAVTAYDLIKAWYGASEPRPTTYR